DRRAADAMAVAGLKFGGRLVERIAVIVERDRVEHDPKRVRLVPERSGCRCKDAFAGSATPELHDLDLLLARAFARERGAAAMRAARGALAGMRDARDPR